MIVLVFVPLLVGWALLHRASTREEWGYVGETPGIASRWGRLAADIIRGYSVSLEEAAAVMLDVMTQATRALTDLGAAFAAAAAQAQAFNESLGEPEQ